MQDQLSAVLNALATVELIPLNNTPSELPQTQRPLVNNSPPSSPSNQTGTPSTFPKPATAVTASIGYPSGHGIGCLKTSGSNPIMRSGGAVPPSVAMSGSWGSNGQQSTQQTNRSISPSKSRSPAPVSQASSLSYSAPAINRNQPKVEPPFSHSHPGIQPEAPIRYPMPTKTALYTVTSPIPKEPRRESARYSGSRRDRAKSSAQPPPTQSPQDFRDIQDVIHRRASTAAAEASKAEAAANTIALLTRRQQLKQQNMSWENNKKEQLKSATRVTQSVIDGKSTPQDIYLPPTRFKSEETLEKPVKKAPSVSTSSSLASSATATPTYSASSSGASTPILGMSSPPSLASSLQKSYQHRTSMSDQRRPQFAPNPRRLKESDSQAQQAQPAPVQQTQQVQQVQPPQPTAPPVKQPAQQETLSSPTQHQQDYQQEYQPYVPDEESTAVSYNEPYRPDLEQPIQADYAEDCANEWQEESESEYEQTDYEQESANAGDYTQEYQEEYNEQEYQQEYQEEYQEEYQHEQEYHNEQEQEYQQGYQEEYQEYNGEYNEDYNEEQEYQQEYQEEVVEAEAEGGQTNNDWPEMPEWQSEWEPEDGTNHKPDDTNQVEPYSPQEQQEPQEEKLQLEYELLMLQQQLQQTLEKEQHQESNSDAPEWPPSKFEHQLDELLLEEEKYQEEERKMQVELLKVKQEQKQQQQQQQQQQPRAVKIYSYDIFDIPSLRQTTQADVPLLHLESSEIYSPYTSTDLAPTCEHKIQFEKLNLATTFPENVDLYISLSFCDDIEEEEVKPRVLGSFAAKWS